MSLKIGIILGTRPEIIKMSSVIKACQEKQLDFFIVHTGQHFDHMLDKQIFDDLGLPQPQYNLGLGGRPYHLQVSGMVSQLTKILQDENPKVVIVQGDTTSVLTGALVANKLGIKVVHHEAGLRSHDLSMLEEVHRIIVDSISDCLFVPTQDAMDNLIVLEGKKSNNIYLVGNTIVDAVLQNIERANKNHEKLDKWGISKGKYILASAHRAENVDDKERLNGIMNGLSETSDALNIPIIFPIHPRTKAKLIESKITEPTNIKFINPVGFLDLLLLESNASLIMTDSGGLQEEAFILNIPCVTLRDNTERPETVKLGANILSGTNSEDILVAAKKMMFKNLKDLNLDKVFGDGTTGFRIISMIENLYG